MMDVEVKKQAKLPLLSRERVTGFTYFEGTTPSMKDVKQREKIGKEFLRQFENIARTLDIIKHRVLKCTGK